MRLNENARTPGMQNEWEILRRRWAESVWGRKVHIVRVHSLGMTIESEKVLRHRGLLDGNGGSKTKTEDLVDLKDSRQLVLLQSLLRCANPYHVRGGVNRRIPRAQKAHQARIQADGETDRREEVA